MVDSTSLENVLASVTLGPDIGVEDGSTEFLMELTEDPPPLVYHYTSADAMHSILVKRQVWASHSGFLNDTTEILHGLERCRSHLKAHAHARHGHFVSTVLGVIDAMIGDDDTQGFDAFIACFSEGDDIVPQWRGYGADGAGYAIGFDLVRTAVITDTAPLRVLYKESDQDVVLDAAIKGYLGVLERSLDAHPGVEEAVARAVGFALVSLLTRLLASFKSDLFFHEREWRLVEFVPKADVNRQSSVRFRPARGVIVPYLELGTRDSTQTPAGSPWCQRLRAGPRRCPETC